MADWMVEVCTSFKCCPRTYFLAVTLFDKYMVACHKQGRVLTNADIHSMGITSIYLASKFEDVFPLHSKVVSQKIAHGAITPQQLMHTIRIQAQKTSFFCFQETERLVAETKMILDKLGSMALLLVKMAI